jgi:hypothetical protein
MKKFILSILILPISLMAQSLEVVSFDSVVVGHPTASSDIYGFASIKNNAPYDIEVMVTRTVDTTIELTQLNAICWGLCYAPEVDTTPSPITIGAGNTNSTDFNGHVYPPMDGTPRTGAITYTFFDKNDPSDQVSITVMYITTESFSVFNNEAKKSEFKAYPNPAKDVVFIDMHNINSGDVRVVVNDVIGNTIMEKQLSTFSNRETIDVHSLRSGYYFFNLYIDGKVVGTKRIHIVQ